MRSHPWWTWSPALLSALVFVVDQKWIDGLFIAAGTPDRVPTFAEGVLGALVDPISLAAVVIPVWLVGVAIDHRRTASAPALIRHGSRVAYLRTVAARASVRACIVIGVMWVVAAITSLRLRPGLGWTAVSEPDGDPLLAALREVGLPIAALALAHSLLLGLALVSMALIVATVSLGATRRTGLIVGLIAVGLGVVSLMAIRGKALAAVGAMFNLGFPEIWLWPVSPYVLWVLLIVGLFLGVARAERSPVRWDRSRVAELVYAALVVLVIIAAIGRFETTSAAELLLAMFYGGDTGRFDLLTFIPFALVWCGPAYLVLLRLSSRDLPALPILLTRLGSLRPWLLARGRDIVLRAAVTAGGIGLAWLLTAAALGLPMGEGISAAALHLLVGGALHIVVLALTVVLVALLAGSELGGLAALLIGVVLSIPALSRGVLPFGLNAGGFLYTDGAPPWRGTVVLLGTLLVLVLIALALTRTPGRQRRILGRIHADH